MRKHPVDDLFKSRLSELEKKPSSAAWEKIQAKTKKERRLAGWIWYAAASVAVTLIAGYMIWNTERSNMQPISKGKFANVTKPEKLPEPIKSLQEDRIQDMKVKLGDILASSDELAKNDTAPKVKRVNINIKETVKPLNVENREQKAETEKLAAIDVKIREEIVELPSAQVTPKIEEVVSPKTNTISAEPVRLIVVAIETNDEEAEDKPKSSRFSKVFRQLKNARAGERVDWEEVGFNPKSLVAKVDDRLRNGEEKVSEKYHHLKEKTKL